jgi:intraflagellar transport protein 56
LNIYSALCYYKQEYFEISLDMMQNYLGSFPDSIVGTNLKACNYFQLMQGKNAEEEFRRLEKNYKGGDLYADYDLLRHNLCVFKGGENALQVLPPLLDLFPEAKLNLVIYYLKNDEVEEAHKLIHDLEPVSPREYMLKGIVIAILGQKNKNPQTITQAQQLFQMIGTSATECDTIPGRQCASSYLFLKGQFDSVVIYLKTIKDYLIRDDDFCWNYGIACAAIKNWPEAQEALVNIENEKYKNDFCYISWLARVFYFL